MGADDAIPGPGDPGVLPATPGMPGDGDGDVIPSGGPVGKTQFMEWINRARATHGMSPLVYDQELSESAYSNNMVQHEKGLGHYVKSDYVSQCVGEGTLAEVAWKWIGDQSDFDILMDSRATRVGFDHDDPFWTVNLAP